jgi:hypothetical protein
MNYMEKNRKEYKVLLIGAVARDSNRRDVFSGMRAPPKDWKKKPLERFGLGFVLP